MPLKKKRTWNLRTRITTELRRLWLYSPERQKAILSARKDDPKKPYKHLCAGCEKEITLKELKVDHIEPMVPVTGVVSWTDTMNSLFCDSPGLQILCVECHKIKTKEEHLQRKAARSKPL